MSRKAHKEAIRARRRRQKIRSRLIWGGLGGVLIAALGFLVWNAVRPRSGQAFPIMANAGAHVPTGNLPVEYNTDPPTSGPHFASSLPRGFYQESDLASLPPNPEGYLLHNQEHGYVIFWYNCAELSGPECDPLKTGIQRVMDDFQNLKLIAFPWDSLDVPVVMTSWGRMEPMSEFDPARAAQFIRSNHNQAPEPQAP